MGEAKRRKEEIQRLKEFTRDTKQRVDGKRVIVRRQHEEFPPEAEQVALVRGGEFTEVRDGFDENGKPRPPFVNPSKQVFGR